MKDVLKAIGAIAFTVAVCLGLSSLSPKIYKGRCDEYYENIDDRASEFDDSVAKYLEQQAAYEKQSELEWERAQAEWEAKEREEEAKWEALEQERIREHLAGADDDPDAETDWVDDGMVYRLTPD